MDNAVQHQLANLGNCYYAYGDIANALLIRTTPYRWSTMSSWAPATTAGNAANNTITVGNGNDTINGGGGTDKLNYQRRSPTRRRSQ
jgi:hypothetical protein